MSCTAAGNSNRNPVGNQEHHGWVHTCVQGEEGPWDDPGEDRVGRRDEAEDPAVWPKNRNSLNNAVSKDPNTCTWQINRGVFGAKHFILDGDAGVDWVGGDGRELRITSGQLAGTRIWWALRKAKHPTGGRAPFSDSGYIAMLHHNELFQHATGAVKFRGWGATEQSVRNNLFIIVEPPTRAAVDGSGVKMTAKRTSLEWAVDGVPQPIEDVYEGAREFWRSNTPVEVLDALKQARGG